jgi:hypothetical protein
LVDRDNKILGGHGRYLAAHSLGLTDVPVISLDRLTEAQAKAFRIADNRLAETSIWDDRLLAESLKELSELRLDFSIEATPCMTKPGGLGVGLSISRSIIEAQGSTAGRRERTDDATFQFTLPAHPYFVADAAWQGTQHRPDQTAQD